MKTKILEYIKKFSKWFLIVFLALVVSTVCRVNFRQSSSALASSVVYIKTDNGHGSGVNIGNGYILTAAHVVAPPFGTDLSVIDSHRKTHKVEVMWINRKYDVALVRIDHANDVAASHLACHRSLERGENLSFVGNPLQLRDITLYGKVANPAIVSVAPWKAVTTVSGQLIPGMSGGPAFDVNNDVVGINVGIAVMPDAVQGPHGVMGYASMGFALSWIVPSHAICMLMDRT